MEIWRDVVGYEGIYEVSDTGQIRTCEGKTTFSSLHGKRVWKQRILKQKIGKDNCCRVELYNEGHTTWLVHRIVAFAFLPVVKGKNFVNHKDGNRLNNSLDNLEWCDHTENNNHAFDNGLIKTGVGVCINNKETGEEFIFRSMTKASEFLGKSHTFISNLFKKGETEYENFIIRRR